MEYYELADSIRKALDLKLKGSQGLASSLTNKGFDIYFKEFSIKWDVNKFLNIIKTLELPCPQLEKMMAVPDSSLPIWNKSYPLQYYMEYWNGLIKDKSSFDFDRIPDLFFEKIKEALSVEKETDLLKHSFFNHLPPKYPRLMVVMDQFADGYSWLRYCWSLNTTATKKGETRMILDQIPAVELVDYAVDIKKEPWPEFEYLTRISLLEGVSGYQHPYAFNTYALKFRRRILSVEAFFTSSKVINKMDYSSQKEWFDKYTRIFKIWFPNRLDIPNSNNFEEVQPLYSD